MAVTTRHRTTKTAVTIMAQIALTPLQEHQLKEQAAAINALQIKMDQAENCGIDCANLKGASSQLLAQITGLLNQFPSATSKPASKLGYTVEQPVTGPKFKVDTTGQTLTIE